MALINKAWNSILVNNGSEVFFCLASADESIVAFGFSFRFHNFAKSICRRIPLDNLRNKWCPSKLLLRHKASAAIENRGF